MESWTELQTWIAGRLTADAWFVAQPAPGEPPLAGPDKLRVPVLTEQIGDLVNKLQAQLNTLGIGIVIVTPLASLPDPDVPTLDLTMPWVVQVQENVLLNRGRTGTNHAALDVVRRVMRLLHHAPHPFNSGPEEMRRLKLARTPFELVQQSPLLTYNVSGTADVLDLPAEPLP